MPAGATFEVVIPPASEKFVHRAQPANTVYDTTYLDHPLTDGKPDAVVSVTQNRNPGGGVGVYNDHPAGARYDEGSGRWAVRNLDGAPMPPGATYNVAVLPAAAMGARGGSDGGCGHRSCAALRRERGAGAHHPGPRVPGPAGAARTASDGRSRAGRSTRAPPGHGGAREAAAPRSWWRGWLAGQMAPKSVEGGGLTAARPERKRTRSKVLSLQY